MRATLRRRPGAVHDARLRKIARLISDETRRNLLASTLATMTDPLHPRRWTHSLPAAAGSRKLRAGRARARGRPPRLYAAVASRFRTDPRRTDEPPSSCCVHSSRPGNRGSRSEPRETVALPLPTRQEVLPSSRRTGCKACWREWREHGITNVRIDRGALAMDGAARRRVALLAHWATTSGNRSLPRRHGGVRPRLRRQARHPVASAAGGTVRPVIHGEARMPRAAHGVPRAAAARGSVFELRLEEREPFAHGTSEAPSGGSTSNVRGPDTAKGRRHARWPGRRRGRSREPCRRHRHLAAKSG